MCCFWESSCTFEYRLCMLIIYLACSHCNKCWEIELLLLLLLILVQGLPCLVSRVKRHLSVLPMYLELQPRQVNWYTRLLLNNNNSSSSISQHLSQWKKACVVVRKCLDKEICNNFQEYFEINEHNCGTRNNGIMLKCPEVKLEFAIQAFCFSAAKIYNELPMQGRKKTVKSSGTC